MNRFWRPTFDPFKELYEHAEAIDYYEDAIQELASVLNTNAEILEKVCQQNVELAGQVDKLTKQVIKLTVTKAL